MSNYLFAAGSNDTIDTIYHFLKDAKHPEELRKHCLGNNKSVLCLSKEISDDGSNFFFKGWFVDPHTESVVIGSEGVTLWEENHKKRLAEEPNSFQGSYFHASWEDFNINVSNDLFSLFPILHFSEKNISVFSDSLYILSRVRTSLGIENSHNFSVLNSRAWGHGLGCALPTFETQVSGIFYLPPGGVIEATIGETITTSVKIIKFKDVLVTKEKSYADTLHSYLNNLYRTLACFADSDYDIELALSGGLDSRILLSLLLAMEKSDRVKIVTNNHQSRTSDFSIVEGLSSEFSFSFNLPTKLPPEEKIFQTSLNDKFKLWKLSCLGLFDMMYFKGDYPKKAKMIRLGGHGAEIAKKTFSNQNIESLIRYRKLTRKALISRSILRNMIEVFSQNKMKKALRRNLTSALNYIQVDSSGDDAVLWHHACYKSPIANGRYLSNSLLGFRPLIDKTLISYSLNHKEASGVDFFRDLLILADPKLASHPFENAKYDMDEEYVSTRLAYLGVQFNPINLVPFKMYAQKEKPENGPPMTFLNLVESLKKSYSTPVAMIRELLNETWNLLDDELKGYFQSTYDSTLAKLGEEKPYFPSAAVGAAKIFSLGLVEDEVSKLGI